jgi:LCP family protein required for cell wall assembly
MWRKVLGGFFYIVFCAVVLSMGSALGWIRQSPLLFKLVEGKIKGSMGIKQANPFEGQDSLTILVLGCDEDRYFGGQQIIRHQARSDMMLVAKLDFKNHRISGISIPRDTLCQVPGYHETKINAYHLLGGPDPDKANALSKEAVETLLPEIHIDRVMTLNFDTFKEIVDLMGGIDIFVPKDMDYDDTRGHLHIHLKMGRRHLDGDQAEGFVRFRHSDDDFHRTGRQRDFMLAFKDTLFKNWAVAPKVMNKAVDLTGRALNEDEIAALALFSQKVGSDNISMGLLPTVDAGNFNLRIDDNKATEALRQYHLVDDPLAQNSISTTP